MCLIAETFTPYNKSNIRWKIFTKKKGGGYTSCFQRLFIWPENRKAKIAEERTYLYKGCPFNSGGFHVFVTRKDTRNALKCLKTSCVYKYCVIRKVRVGGFICGGLTDNIGLGLDGMKSEAWREVEILD